MCFQAVKDMTIVHTTLCPLTWLPTGIIVTYTRSNDGNAMHVVRTQCEVLDVSKYSYPSFGPFSQVFGSVPGFFLAS